MCRECYADDNRVTPLLNPQDCLRNHTQYICGSCGRCICIEQDGKRGLRRWNFPFKTLDIAKLYLRKSPAGFMRSRMQKAESLIRYFQGRKNCRLF